MGEFVVGGGSGETREQVRRFFDGLSTFDQIIERISLYNTPDPAIAKDMAQSSLELVKMATRFKEGKTVDAEKIRLITRTEGLRDAVLRAMIPDFSTDSNIYNIRTKLIGAKLQQEQCRQVRERFMEDKADEKALDTNLDIMLEAVSYFIEVLEDQKASGAAVPEVGPYFAILGSKKDLLEAVRRSVRILTPTTEVSS